MKQFVLIILLTAISTSTFCQPKVSPQQIMQYVINRYWIIGFDGSTKTSVYYRASDKESVRKMGRGGIVFKKDGSFEEIHKPGCAMGRTKPYLGTWRITNDTIIVKTNQNHDLVLKIIKVDDNSFTSSP